jgi:hypothetical protein
MSPLTTWLNSWHRGGADRPGDRPAAAAAQAERAEQRRQPDHRHDHHAGGQHRRDQAAHRLVEPAEQQDRDQIDGDHDRHHRDHEQQHQPARHPPYLALALEEVHR